MLLTSLDPCPQTVKMLANIITKVHTGAFDDELKLIVEGELKQTGFTFPWVDLSKDHSGKLIYQFKLAQLNTACHKLMEMEPQQLTSTSATGGVDRALTSAAQGQGASIADCDDEDELRRQTIAKVSEYVAKLVSFVVREPTYDATGLARTMTSTLIKIPNGFDKDNNANKDKDNKDNHKRPAPGGEDRVEMWLIFAELFPGHSKLANNDTFRGIPMQCSDDFQNLVDWVSRNKKEEDAVYMGAGRSDVVTDTLRNKFKSADGDDFIEVWVVYVWTPRAV